VTEEEKHQRRRQTRGKERTNKPAFFGLQQEGLLAKGGDSTAENQIRGPESRDVP
jgi:hypothetical protein